MGVCHFPRNYYLERRAAALQSKGLIPVTWLPKIWEAVGALRRERDVDHFGLKRHPLDSAMRLPVSPAPRRILGHQWTPPPQPIDFPLTPRERERAPWPWQTLEALNDLKSGLIASTYGPLERDKADAYLAAVLTMPCGSDEEAQRLVEAVQGSSHYKTPAIMATLRNIALNPRFALAPVHVGTTYADATRLWNDPQSWAIGAAGLLDMLRSSPHSEGRNTAAYTARSLREVWVDGRTQRRALPAAVILEMGRLALDPKTGGDWTRLYAYAFSVIEALDDPPFPAERGMDPKAPAVAQRLAEFALWFAQQRADLETLAAEQKPALDAAEELLASTVTCR